MQRITYPAACVLQALDNGEVYGFGIMEATDLSSGTVYQTLRRFEKAGLVQSSWETPEVAFEGRRPRRRNYQLTKDGHKALTQAAERYSQHLAIFGAGQKTRPAG